MAHLWPSVCHCCNHPVVSLVPPWLPAQLKYWEHVGSHWWNAAVVAAAVASVVRQAWTCQNLGAWWLEHWQCWRQSWRSVAPVRGGLRGLQGACYIQGAWGLPLGLEWVSLWVLWLVPQSWCCLYSLLEAWQSPSSREQWTQYLLQGNHAINVPNCNAVKSETISLFKTRLSQDVMLCHWVMTSWSMKGTTVVWNVTTTRPMTRHHIWSLETPKWKSKPQIHSYVQLKEVLISPHSNNNLPTCKWK